VAIPLYNEREVLPELLRRVGAVLDATPGGPHELVLVDDGSTDGTGELLEQAAGEDPRLVVLRLSRNFGHQAAVTAALDHASGDAVVVMDGDLQDPPEAIPEMLAKHREGHDVVYAVRASRRESWAYRLAYFLFYRLINSLSNIKLPLDAGDFALMSRPAVEALQRAPERNRYVRGLRSWIGFSQVGLPLERPARQAGRSKYSTFKLLKLAFDGIFSFSTVPLRLAILLGLVAITCCLSYVGYAVYAKLVLDQSPQGFTALIVGIVFSLGVQLLFLGVIGEYVGRIYHEVKQRPHYVVRQVIRREG
jgi:dolichol-phosphate mannosyltransferase